MEVRGERSRGRMKVNMAVPLPAGTRGSESPRSGSSGSGPAPAAGGPPPGDRAGSADPSPPHPTPHSIPSVSPRSAGPGHVATGWMQFPCAGQWGRRPVGPGRHGGTPREGTRSGQAGGREGLGRGRGHLTTATKTRGPSVRAGGSSSSSSSRRGPAGWPRTPGPAISTQPDAELSALSAPQPHLLITPAPAPPHQKSRSQHASPWIQNP